MSKNIVVDVIANTDKFKSGLSKATQQTESFGGKIKGTAVGVGIFTGVIAGASAALFALADNTAKAGDNFQKMSIRTGISAENLSRLDFAAKRSGTNLTTVESAVRYLDKGMLDASNGIGIAKRGFDMLGISVKDSHGHLRSSIDVMQEVSEKLSHMKNATERIAAAQYIFGSSFGTQLLPLLTNGKNGISSLMKESDKLGYTWSTKDANAAAEFEDRITDLKSAFDGLKRRLLINSFPFFEGAITGATTFITNLNNATTTTDSFKGSVEKAGLMGMALFEGLNITIVDIKYTYLKTKKAIEDAPITVKIKIEQWEDTLKSLFKRGSSDTFSGPSSFGGGGGGGSSAEGDTKSFEEERKANLQQIQNSYDKAVDTFTKLVNSTNTETSAMGKLGQQSATVAKNIGKAANNTKSWHKWNIEGISSNRLLNYVGSLTTESKVKHIVEVQLKWNGRKIQIDNVNNTQLINEIGRAVLQQISGSRALAFGTGG